MKKELGLTHIYCGDGKGKTTAAMGLALRAIENNFKVVIAQFLKSGKSSEIILLKKYPNVRFFSYEKLNKFTNCMNETELSECKNANNEILNEVINLCNSDACDVLILDEIIACMNKELLDVNKLYDFIKNRPSNIEVVMTGRNPQEKFIELADYVSEIRKIKHPYDKGINARLGIDK